MAQDSVPQGLWIKCDSCREILYHREVSDNLHVCPRCSHHFRIAAELRLRQLFDGGRFKVLYPRVRSTDPLGFVDSKPYIERLKTSSKRLGTGDALLVGEGEISRHRAVVAAMEYGFMGGSMGSVVGEKITRAAERCVERRLPLVVGRLLGRRPHAGGRPVADADGEDLGARWRGCARRACRTSPCSPTRPPAASPRASPCSATSTSPSRTR